MNEQNYSASQMMIKIDGTRIKEIRESKGLTQLYIATAVEVTTDTVSRWENRRYPTIKKENGLKLAEALEVELEEILDTTDKDEPPETEEPVSAESHLSDSAPEINESQPLIKPWYNKIGHLGIIVVTLILVSTVFYFNSQFNRSPVITEVNVKRIVSPHFIAGQPLPVFLHVEKASDQPVSIILKENLPPGCTLESASPTLSGNSSSEIKWLTKISESTLFFYTIVTDRSFSGNLSFSGVAKNALNDDGVAISGDIKTASGFHHWADTNEDNRISDEEILVVYDLLSGDTDQIIDLDLLEEMWLGEGYVWAPDQQKFTIME